MKKFMAVIFVGIIFLGVGGFLLYQGMSLVKKCTEESTATVVDMKQELDTDSNGMNYLYYPIIEYDADGDTIRVTMSSGSSHPAYNINDKITILYNPSKTEQFIVKGDKSSNVMAIVFMTIGALVTGYGVVIAFKKVD